MRYFTNTKIKKILKYYRKIWAISFGKRLLEWDSETYMPEKSYKERGLALAQLEVLKQRFYLSKKFVNLVKEAEKEENLNEYERGVIRVLNRYIDYYKKLPPEFLKEFEKVISEAKIKWREAKQKSDFSIFKESLEKIVELSKKQAEYLGYEEHPYDALLDIYEEGWKTRDVEVMFEKIKPELLKIYRKVREEGRYPMASPLESERYKKENMKKLNIEILKNLGFNFNYSRIDESAHPFTESIGITDVRITTWYHGKDFRRSLLATIHEFGHALYELQIDKRFIATPIGEGVSLGIHESQSRFWENIIGRSYYFVEKYYWLLKQYLPFLEKYSIEEIYYYFNIVRPELIRVEADEITYHFHIMLRFELEKEMIEGNIMIGELPEIWNDKIEEYLGIRPEKDSEGVLQDIHWSLGSIGYFPTYSIGSILSAQIKYHLEAEIGTVEALIKTDKLDMIRRWLKEKIHKYGSMYEPKKLIMKAFGEPFNPDYFIDYLKEKYLYGKVV